jgi:hypothetical protein
MTIRVGKNEGPARFINAQKTKNVGDEANALITRAKTRLNLSALFRGVELRRAKSCIQIVAEPITRYASRVAETGTNWTFSMTCHPRHERRSLAV